MTTLRNRKKKICEKHIFYLRYISLLYKYTLIYIKGAEVETFTVNSSANVLLKRVKKKKKKKKNDIYKQ